jgi:hypothetical protein
LANDRTKWENFTSALCSERSYRRWWMECHRNFRSYRCQAAQYE